MDSSVSENELLHHSCLASQAQLPSNNGNNSRQDQKSTYRYLSKHNLAFHSETGKLLLTDVEINYNNIVLFTGTKQIIITKAVHGETGQVRQSKT